MVPISAFRASPHAALTVALLLAALGYDVAAAEADTKFEAHYRVTLAGWEIGAGAWKVDLANGRYTMTATGQSSGFASVFAGGNGSATARGAIRGNRVIPSDYALTVRTRRNVDQVRMGLTGGAVNNLSVEPPVRPNPNHVPLVEAHKRGVVDPFSAGILPRASAGGLGTDICKRTVSIFDGRHRFDLALSFKRMEQVRSESGYSGPAVVCAVRYNPVGGHDQAKYATRFLRESRDIEVWYAPIDGTRLVAVYRIALPTAFGPAVLEATRFVSATSTKRSQASGSHRQ